MFGDRAGQALPGPTEPRWTSKGNKAHGRNERRSLATVALTTTNFVDGARPRSRAARGGSKDPHHALRVARSRVSRLSRCSGWTHPGRSLGDVGVRFGGSELHRIESSARFGGTVTTWMATAAVTRCGCRRREDFEGCEPRRGERHCECPAFGPVFGRPPGVGRRCTRNATNPCPAAGCNRPATSARRKPSRWGGTTRTERDSTGGTRRTDGSFGSREWTRDRPAGERAQPTNPTRGRAAKAVPPQSSALEGSEVHEGFRETGFGRRRGASPGNASKARPATVEGHGGRGKDHRPATASRAWAIGFTTLSWRP